MEISTARGFGRFAVLLLPVLGVAFFAWYAVESPRVALLCSQDEAHWIKPHSSIDLDAINYKGTVAEFRSDFHVPAGFIGGQLRVRALRCVTVGIDGKLIFDTGPRVANWKQEYRIALPADLAAGVHRLELLVQNESGPSLVLVVCSELNIATSDQWEATGDGKSWGACAEADQWSDSDLVTTCKPKLGEMPPVLLLALGLVVVGALISRRIGALENNVEVGERLVAGLRWVLLGAISILGVNNLVKLPGPMGYDAGSHAAYIHFVARKFYIPMPDGGWQFFQTLLYYLLSAVPYRILRAANFTREMADQWLRIVPVASSVVMVEICYRVGRYVFPKRSRAQIITCLAGSLLPMNLYMAPVLSNEPMAACIGAGAVCIAISMIVRANDVSVVGVVVRCGLLLGAAVMTKLSAVILVAPICGAVIFLALRRRLGWLKGSLLVAAIPGIVVLVAAPYFIRNLIVMGAPSYVSYLRGFATWNQYPGYLTPAQFFEFGHVFTGPVFTGTQSVWDSIYGTLMANTLQYGVTDFEHRPRFHYGLMWCVLWVGIVPVIAFFVAVVRSISILVRSGSREIGNRAMEIAPIYFCVVTVGLFTAAIVYVYSTLAIYSCAKASYMLAATPCIAVLVAAGVEWIGSGRSLKHAVFGLIFCWGVISYLTYFIY
jgi:4-amino-4-deoxy-L-arabinose transferase-like glycosyltransferase